MKSLSLALAWPKSARIGFYGPRAFRQAGPVWVRLGSVLGPRWVVFFWLNPLKVAFGRSWAALGPALAPFFWLLASSGPRLPAQGAAGCQKEVSGVPKTKIVGILFLASRAAVLVTFFYLFPTRRCFKFIALCGVREKRANGLRPTKTNVFS